MSGLKHVCLRQCGQWEHYEWEIPGSNFWFLGTCCCLSVNYNVKIMDFWVLFGHLLLLSVNSRLEIFPGDHTGLRFLLLQASLFVCWPISVYVEYNKVCTKRHTNKSLNWALAVWVTNAFIVNIHVVQHQ